LLIGGSADLAKSNKTNLTFDGAAISIRIISRAQRHFGVREQHGAIVNGMTLSETPRLQRDVF